MDEPLNLIGAHEIRDMLGVSRQRVYQLAGREDFPRPFATLAQGKIWLVEDVEAWIRTHRSATLSRPRRPRVGKTIRSALHGRIR
jgi:predicted DNA-binding transcriptional regulator AlpA